MKNQRIRSKITYSYQQKGGTVGVTKFWRIFVSPKVNPSFSSHSVILYATDLIWNVSKPTPAQTLISNYVTHWFRNNYSENSIEGNNPSNCPTFCTIIQIQSMIPSFEFKRRSWKLKLFMQQWKKKQILCNFQSNSNSLLYHLVVSLIICVFNHKNLALHCNLCRSTKKHQSICPWFEKRMVYFKQYKQQ